MKRNTRVKSAITVQLCSSGVRDSQIKGLLSYFKPCGRQIYRVEESRSINAIKATCMSLIVCCLLRLLEFIWHDFFSFGMWSRKQSLIVYTIYHLHKIVIIFSTKNLNDIFSRVSSAGKDIKITRLNKYRCSRINVVLSTLNNAVFLLETSDAFRYAQNNS